MLELVTHLFACTMAEKDYLSITIQQGSQWDQPAFVSPNSADLSEELDV